MRTLDRKKATLDARQLPRMFDREPPHSIEAEMCLLGAMILNHEVIDDVLNIVSRSEAFYREAHGALFDQIVRLHNDRQTGDLVQLTQALKDSGVLEGVGGEDYLVELAESVPVATNAIHYAKIVWAKAKRRGLAKAAGQILFKTYDESTDEARLVAEAEQEILAVGDQDVHGDAIPLGDVISRAMDAGAQRQAGVDVGVKTGIASLDAIIVGFQPGDYIIVGARPSMGKTCAALTIARNIAASGTTVCIFSLEMGDVSLADRLLCAEAGVDSKKWRRGAIDLEEARKIQRAADSLAELPIYIDPRADMTVQEARAAARRVVKRQGVGVIMIDYLQLLSDQDTSANDLNTRTTSISRNIKAMARENNVPVVCLSQLNRGPENRPGNRPRRSDLRDSGSIEQDADVILLLHREAYYHQDDEEWLAMNRETKDYAEMIVAKNRNGELGTADTIFDGKYQRFLSC